MHLIATSNDTHAPDAYADRILAELVPDTPNMPVEVRAKVFWTREQLRHPVLLAMEGIRNHERDSLASLDHDERLQVAASINALHNGPPALSVHALHHVLPKLSGEDAYLDRYVDPVCRRAAELDGDKPSASEMVNRVKRVLGHWIANVQNVERSHFVTSNQYFKREV